MQPVSRPLFGFVSPELTTSSGLDTSEVTNEVTQSHRLSWDSDSPTELFDKRSLEALLEDDDSVGSRRNLAAEPAPRPLEPTRAAPATAAPPAGRTRSAPKPAGARPAMSRDEGQQLRQMVIERRGQLEFETRREWPSPWLLAAAAAATAALVWSF